MLKKRKKVSFVDVWGVKDFVRTSTLFVRYGVSKLGLTWPEYGAIHIIHSFKWSADNPWVSVSTIAELLDMTERGAQKLLQRLVIKGFLRIIERPGRTNCYDFSPLYAKLVVLEHDIEAEEQKLIKVLEPPTLGSNVAPEPNVAITPAILEMVPVVQEAVTRLGPTYTPPVHNFKVRPERIHKVIFSRGFDPFIHQKPEEIALVICCEESNNLALQNGLKN